MKRSNMFIIGITGSIASGKSVVSEILKQNGIKIIDADVVSRQCTEPGSEGAKLIKQFFGKDVFDEEDKLLRRKLGEIVFANKNKLIELNNILHPLIVSQIKAQLENYRQQGKATVALDAPLLIETGLDKLCNEVWLVVADDQIRLNRLILRDNLTNEQAIARMNNQTSQKYKSAFATRILYNEGNYNQLKIEVEKLLNKIRG